MGFWDKARENKNKNDDFVKLLKSEDKIYSSFAKYGGGHPAVMKVCNGEITVNKLGLFFKSGLLYMFHIPLEDIINAEYKNESQISKDVTLTRLVLLGFFAFGLKKKRKDEQNFLILQYKIANTESKIIFDTEMAGNIASAILKAKQEFGCNNKMEDVKQIENNDIPNQIRQLAELKNEGILTEEEFQKKKDELLSKM